MRHPPAITDARGGRAGAQPLSRRVRRLAPPTIDRYTAEGAGAAIDLAHGHCEWDGGAGAPEPGELSAGALTAACGHAPPEGPLPLRSAVARALGLRLGTAVDPAAEVTLTQGTAQALYAALLALVDPGDEVIVFEPYHEGFLHAVELAGARVRLVRMHPPDWEYDERELRAAFTTRTRAVVVNSPHNPTGRVLGPAEVRTLTELCAAHRAGIVSDEAYAATVYEGTHHSPWQYPGGRERTVVIGSLSLTHRTAGRRIGYAAACAPLTDRLRLVQQTVARCAAAPLDAVSAAALARADFSAAYHLGLREELRRKRDLLVDALNDAGLPTPAPQGAVFAFSGTLGRDSERLTQALARDLSLAAVPGTCFFAGAHRGSGMVRFCFARRDATLAAALAGLPLLRSGGVAV
ncbi:pyridoxal phosphate-dependent aminotransferase [Streptomyces yaizuensis]|uniref:Pyridoxal phosphate-dependent aminotransferase n=1 Tax=Streptomyces yaizuensis TaxID=2989713 RepID=A0ABQ5NZS2_9ACTN|nr:pyridoxal phosphate-dependent aminotransferase [Streptomyces sp. YSPA8]GLF95848.1 pyridoxal phosphate-dependent aminotransferase [Streptomyces sp. YSPA8]